MEKCMVQKHPNEFLLGCLLQHVNQLKLESTEPVKLAHQNWTISKQFGDPTKANFFAALYVCAEHSQAVLAFRGYKVHGQQSSKLKKIKDLYKIVAESIGEDQRECFTATYQAIHFMRQNQCLLTFTGHAFGAWLAELAIFYSHKYFDCDFIDNLKAVTFESPGMYAHTEAHQSNRIDGTQDVTPFLNIVTYLSSPNLMNCTHRHIGKIYHFHFREHVRVPKWCKEKAVKNKYLSQMFAMQGCQLETMLGKFDSETGRPIGCFEMADWPTIIYGQEPFYASASPIIESVLEVVFNLVPPLDFAKHILKMTLPLFRHFLPDIEIVRKFATGENSLEQIFETYDPKKQQTLHHKDLGSHYVVRADSPNWWDSPIPHFKGTLEWYLWKLTKADEKKMADKFYDNFTELRSKYLILKPDRTGRRHIVTTNDEDTVEDVKDKMRHHLKKIPTLADYLSGVEVETPIETQIFRMQDKAQNCSVSQIREEERTQNYKIVPEINRLYELCKVGVKEYFISNDVASLHLANCLHVFNVMASFTLYNQHDGEKARNICKTARKLAEQFMIKNLVFPEHFDFDKMADVDITRMTSALGDDVPKMYTILSYFQGRSYIYDNEDLAEGIKCFELSHKLGSKLKMFDGYLSLGRGVLVIDRLMIENQWRTGKIPPAEAANQLMKNLVKLKALKADTDEYEEGYRPGKKGKTMVKPIADNYNMIECNEQEIRHYRLLIELTNDQVLLNDYVQELRHTFKSIIDKFKLTGGLNPRKMRSVYNNLGFSFLMLHDKHQDLTEFQAEIYEALAEHMLAEPPVGDLYFAKAIFRLAEPHDDDAPEYVHAETYDGLFKASKKLLDHEGLRGKEHDDICESLKKYRRKRDTVVQMFHINPKLFLEFKKTAVTTHKDDFDCSVNFNSCAFAACLVSLILYFFLSTMI